MEAAPPNLRNTSFSLLLIFLSDKEGHMEALPPNLRNGSLSLYLVCLGKRRVDGGAASKPPQFVLRYAIESSLNFLHVLLAERSIEKKGPYLSRSARRRCSASASRASSRALRLRNAVGNLLKFFSSGYDSQSEALEGLEGRFRRAGSRRDSDLLQYACKTVSKTEK